MIRLIQRRLIVPRGDTGTFSIPVLAGKDSGDTSIFTIFSPLTHRKIFEKVMENSNGVLKMDLTHGDTVNLPVGEYVWDIKFYTDPVFVDEKLVSGTEVDSYYSAFQLPVCEIRETGDNLLMADDAPDSKLAPEQINYIDAAIIEIHNSKDAAASSAAEADTSATNAETSASNAAASAQTAQDSEDAAVAAKLATQAAASDAANSASMAAISANSAGNSATAASNSATSAASSATEAAASVSAVQAAQAAAESAQANAATQASNASASATTAANSASAASISQQAAAASATAALASQQASATSETNAANSATAAAASAQQAAATAQAIHEEIPTKVSQLENDSGYLTQHQDISGKANSADLATVATSGSYNDLSNKPFIPSAISDLTDDSGHYTKPAGGIPASDLANGVLDVWSGLTYHTSTMSTDSDSFVLGGATDAPTEINKCLVTPTPAANVIPKFDYQGRLHSVTPEEEWDGSNAVATTEYVDNMISDNMPEIPTNVSELNNDAGYITGYTETDPTVPAWAKASQKPSYTAAEVGAPTVQEMNSAISTAIGSVNSFDMAIVQTLPTQDINTHTIYLVPKTGETNDVYDEYVYINNAWEMVGNTQIDLSNYVQKDQYANTTRAGLVKVGINTGLVTSGEGLLSIVGSNESIIKQGTNSKGPIVPKYQDVSTFYGLAKAAGDTTQSQSDNAVGTYTTEAKAAIRSMLGAAASADLTVQDVQVNGTSIVQNGVANVPVASYNDFGVSKINSSNGIKIISTGFLAIDMAATANIKLGTNSFRPIVPANQHESAFYALAKAAGDTTQSQSNNAVGTYTDEAKTAILNMFGLQLATDTEIQNIINGGAGA